jgi:hypothetical protein
MEGRDLFLVGLEAWILVVLSVLGHARDLDVQEIDRDILLSHSCSFGMQSARMPSVSHRLVPKH